MGVEMLLDMGASTFPDRLIVGARRDGLAYQDLSRIVAEGAGMLSRAGARSVAFIGVNGPTLPSLIFASARAGIPLAPLNYRLSGGQIAGLLAQLDAPYIVIDRAHQHLVGERSVSLTERWLADARSADPIEKPAAPADDDVAVILFTSGTTSAPKAALLRHENLVSYVIQTVEFAAADEREAILVSVPPYHIAGVGASLTNIYSGRRMVYLSDFAPDAWLQIVRDEAITNAMVVPTMLARVVEHLAGRPADAPALRTLAYGGAKMPSTVLEAALKAFPSCGFVNAYGLTETSSTIAVLGPEDHRVAFGSSDPVVRARLGSIGRFVPGVEYQMRGESGEPVADGEVGELWVRGPQVSGEYRGIGSVVDAEGWFPTRDLARADSAGYVFIEGRCDDTIIRAGENIAPAEIEEVLARHPVVRDVAVVGVPDVEWGQRLVAVIVPKPDQDVDASALKSYVRARLRGSRTPDDVVVREELPYTPTGKLLRRILLDELTSTR